MQFPRIFASSKYQASWAAAAIISIPLIFTVTDPQIDRATKKDAVTNWAWAIVAMFGISVGGTAVEDYAAKRDVPGGGKQSQPTVQVNTGSPAANTMELPSPAPASGNSTIPPTTTG